MNITNNEAGAVSHKHILSKGFEVFDTLEGKEFSSPQYRNDKFKIIGGYWSYEIKERKTGKKLWEGWWNSNEEFDVTIKELNKLVIK